MNANTTGTANVAVGHDALEKNTTGSYSVAIGWEALENSVQGNGSVAIGYRALHVSTESNHQVAIGYEVLNSATSAATGNIMMGYRCGHNLTTGDDNTAIGYAAMYSITEASRNTVMGMNALYAVTDAGHDNAAFGYQALKANTAGDNNSALGTDAGLYITTGSNNTMLGKSSGTNSSPSGSITTGSNTICLGNDDVAELFCADTSISSSDARDKTDVERFTHGLSWINKLSPVTYRWDKRSWYVDDPNTTINEGVPDGSKKRPRLHIGFLAQEHLEVEKEHGFGTERDNMIITDITADGDRYGMKYERLVPVLVNAIKEQQEQIETLKAKVAALESN